MKQISQIYKTETDQFPDFTSAAEVEQVTAKNSDTPRTMVTTRTSYLRN